MAKVIKSKADLLSAFKELEDSTCSIRIKFPKRCFGNLLRKKPSIDILESVAKKHGFEYPEDKMVELSKRIKVIVDDKAGYTDWATREDIKANLQVDLILLLEMPMLLQK